MQWLLEKMQGLQEMMDDSTVTEDNGSDILIACEVKTTFHIPSCIDMAVMVFGFEVIL